MCRRLIATLVSSAVLLVGCGGNSASSDSTTAASFNDADVMFAQMMIPHHEQAVEMADIASDPTVQASQPVTSLAAQIKAAQDPEIDLMKGLLATWGQPLTPDDGEDHSSMMKGMLTPQQLDELATRRGGDFDAAWATAMIAHHEGAVDMAEDVIADGSDPEIKKLAQTILATQQAEIDQLRTLAGG